LNGNLVSIAPLIARALRRLLSLDPIDTPYQEPRLLVPFKRL
jgi:hypothetical protein